MATTLNTHAGVFTITLNGTEYNVTGPATATFDIAAGPSYAFLAACNFCTSWALTNEVNILRMRGQDLTKGIVTVNASWKSGAADNAALVQNALSASFPPTP